MKRLVESLGDEVARSALRSAREDAPSASSRERAALAVGLAVGSVVAASASAGAAAASVTKVAVATTGAKAVAASTSGVGAVAAVAPSAPLVIPGLGGGILAGLGGAKLVAVLVAVGALAVGALSLPSSTPPVSSASRAPEASVAAPREPSLHTAQRSPSLPAPAVAAHEVSAASSSPVPSAVAAPTAPVPPAPPTASSVVPVVPAAPEDLTQSMALLESARGALAAGEPARALPILAGYERRFPNGTLRQEAEVLTIDALAGAHSDDAALAAAARFLAAAPDSPHAKHVRAVAAVIRAGAPASRTIP